MKKGQIAGIVTVIVGLVLAIVIFTSLAFPQIRTLYQAQTNTEDIVHTALSNTTITLSELDLVSGGLTIAGLTVSDNYSVDYDTAVVVINDSTVSDTYTATYSYYASGYVAGQTGARALAGVLILLLIVGLAVAGLRMFGAM